MRPSLLTTDGRGRLGVHGTLHGIAPLTYDFRAAGPAFTVQYEPAGTARGSVGDFLDDVPPGAIVLIDNQGRTDVTVWGGIMTEIAADRGVAGTVINGVCRDVSTSLEQNYPLFSRGRFKSCRRPQSLGSAQTGYVSLAMGEPDSGTPAAVVDAAIAALNKGRTRYAPMTGSPELRNAIAGLAATMTALINPGDRVLIPEPP